MSRVSRDKIQRVHISLFEIAQNRKDNLGITKKQSYKDMAQYIKATVPDFAHREVITTPVDNNKIKKNKRMMKDFFQI